jgi:hypothetical protein
MKTIILVAIIVVSGLLAWQGFQWL